MKIILLLALILLITGAIIGFMLYPGHSQYGQMLADSNSPELAEKEFEAIIGLTNNLSRQAVIPLSRLYFTSGKPQKAIDLLRRRINANGKDKDELELLSNYYLDSFDPEDYLNTVASIAKISDSYSSYARLAYLYEMRGYSTKYLEALRSLLKTPDAKADFNYFYPLIYSDMTEGKYNEAYSLIRSYLAKQKSIESIPEYNLKIIIDILLRLDKVDYALKTLENYVLSPTPDLNSKLALIPSISYDYPDEAKKMLLYMLNKNPGNPLILRSLFELNSNNFEVYSETYQVLLMEFEANKLPPEMDDILLLQIVYSENPSQLTSFLNKIPIENFSARRLTEVAQYIYLTHNTSEAELFYQRLGPELLSYMPITTLLLEACINDVPANKMVENILDNKIYLSDTDLSSMVFLLYTNDYAGLAFKMIKNLVLRKALRIAGPEAFAYIVFHTSNSEEYIEKLTNEMAKKSAAGKAPIEQSLFFLTSLTRNWGEANKILDKLSSKEKKGSWLTALYELSLKLNNSESALFASISLVKIIKTQKTEMMLINSYILNEKFEDALKLLNSAELHSKEYSLLYANLFTKLYENKEAQTLKTHEKDFEVLCKNLKENWVKYTLPDKASIIYLFVISSKTENAISSFFSIADKLPYNSPVFQDLINIPEFINQQKVVNFFAFKASNTSNLKEKKIWLDYLSQTGNNAEALKILDSASDETQRDSYFFSAMYPKLIYSKLPSEKLNEDLFNNYAETYIYLLYKTGDIAGFAKVLNKILNSNLNSFSNEQKIAISSILLKTNCNRAAYKLFSDVPIDKAIAGMTPGELSEVYWKNAYQNEGLTTFASLLNKSPSALIKEKIIKVQALLYCSLNESEKFKSLLLSGRINDIRSLSDDIYAVTEKTQHPAPLLIFAEELYKQYPNSGNYQFYIYALLANKKYETVLSLIENPIETTYKTSVFLEALNGVNPKKKKALFIKYDKVIKDIYDKLFNSKKTDIPDLRNLGYLLADSGNKDMALNIFYRLSLNAPAESDDVKELVFLMGEDSAWKKGVELLEKRALASKGNEQLQWLKYLNQTGNWDQVIKIIEQN